MRATDKARYLVTAAFSVATPDGSRTFNPGAVLSLVPDKAAPYILGGFLREIAPDPDGRPRTAPGGGLLIPWRTATGRLLYLAETPAAAGRAPEGAATFQIEELDMLRGATPETVNMVIDIKELFGNGTLQRDTITAAALPTAGTGPLYYNPKGV